MNGNPQTTARLGQAVSRYGLLMAVLLSIFADHHPGAQMLFLVGMGMIVVGVLIVRARRGDETA